MRYHPAPAGRRTSLTWLGWALLLMPLLAPALAFCQGSLSADINVVKAAYLYRFTSYVEWPPTAFESPSSPLRIGVADNEAVYGELARLAAAGARLARPLEVRKLAAGDDLRGLHALFAGGRSLAAWASKARDEPILIVGDDDDGLAMGAALNFVVIDQRLRFEASRAAFDRARLKASAHLLALATRVVEPR